jgi:hypothetical protein
MQPKLLGLYALPPAARVPLYDGSGSAETDSRLKAFLGTTFGQKRPGWPHRPLEIRQRSGCFCLPGRAGAVRDHALGEIVLAYELRRAGARLCHLLAESAHIHGRQRRRRCRAARKDARQQERHNPDHRSGVAKPRGSIVYGLRRARGRTPRHTEAAGPYALPPIAGEANLG